MIDYSELKKQAEAARDNCPIWYAADCFSLRHMDLGDSGFVAEANPRIVLALIAEIESLRRDADRYRWMRDKAPRLLIETPLIAMCAKDGSVCYRDHGSEMLLHGAEADVAIDAAMSKEASNV